MNYSLNSSRLSRFNGGVGLLYSHVVYNTAHAAFVGFWRGSCLRSEEGYLILEGSSQLIQGIPIGTPRLGLQLFEHLCGRVYLIGTGSKSSKVRRGQIYRREDE